MTDEVEILVLGALREYMDPKLQHSHSFIMFQNLLSNLYSTFIYHILVTFGFALAVLLHILQVCYRDKYRTLYSSGHRLMEAASGTYLPS